MKIAVLARADQRGLGIMSAAFARHVPGVDRVMVVDMGRLSSAFPNDLSQYPPGTPVVPFLDGRLPEAQVREWLAGADVCWYAETPYDGRLLDWARDAGVVTVCHAMPEFHRPELEAAVTWAPTRWRLDLLPRDARAVPVAVTAPEPAPVERAPGLRVLHVAGHRAAQDRNGTGVLAAALCLVKAPLTVQVECQDRRLPPVRGGLHVTVRTHLGGRADRWSMYAGFDLLVMPRRYGGLALPVLEAMASGLGVVMTDAEPNRTWPIAPIPTLDGFPGEILTPGGAIEVHRPAAQALAAILTDLARDPTAVADLRMRAWRWAQTNTWEALGPLYRDELALAAGVRA